MCTLRRNRAYSPLGFIVSMLNKGKLIIGINYPQDIWYRQDLNVTLLCRICGHIKLLNPTIGAFPMGKANKHQHLKLVDTRTHSNVDTGRGQINSNALAALVTSKIFKQQVVPSKKGKGSFNRKVKHSGRESYPIAA